METLSLNGFPLFPVFLLMFFLIYLFGYFVLFINWGSNRRSIASSSFMSLFHGAPALFLAIVSITLTPTQLDFSSQNTRFQNLIFDYSFAYFIIDLLHYLIFLPKDVVLYVAHHVATLFMLLTCRCLIGHGAFPLLVLLVLAEVTSPCQNVWTLAWLRRDDVVAAAKLYDKLAPVFYSFYTIARGILGPMFALKMWRAYSSGEVEGVIPNWVWMSWMVVIVVAILLSILWIMNLWIMLFRERTGKKHKVK